MTPAKDLPNLHALGAALARELGDGWTAQAQRGELATYDYADLVHPDGRAFSLGTEWRDASRVTVSGTYPKRLSGGQASARDWGAIPYNATAPSITVSRTRPAATLAADIRRRFLDAYTPIYWACLYAAAEEYERETSTDKLLAAVVTIGGEALSPQRDRDHERQARRVHLAADVEGYGFVDVSGPDRITLDLHLPADLGLALVQRLGDAVRAGMGGRVSERAPVRNASLLVALSHAGAALTADSLAKLPGRVVWCRIEREGAACCLAALIDHEGKSSWHFRESAKGWGLGLGVAVTVAPAGYPT